MEEICDLQKLLRNEEIPCLLCLVDPEKNSFSVDLGFICNRLTCI